jgi:hypothetical protein
MNHIVDMASHDMETKFHKHWFRSSDFVRRDTQTESKVII